MKKRIMPGILILLMLQLLPVYADTPVITVSIPPQAYFIHQIAGENRFDVNIMIPNGQSPAVYSPKPSQMMKMNRSDAFFLIGHPAFLFETKHIFPYVNRRKDIPVFNLYREALNVSYTPDDHDPHLWMSPILMNKMLKDLTRFLHEFYPEDSLLFRQNAQRLSEKIITLQDSIQHLIREHQVREFFIYHPSWGYFARDFNLSQIAIETRGHEPGPGHLMQISRQVHEHDHKKIIVQKGFNQKSAEALAHETGAGLAEADPLTYDWLESIRTMTTILVKP
ncbi:metal ABC transporter solute-binding protein, Zn/Mn family [Fidelibacter multiformis]|uniref:metal ABC transporter solute-binding protein, Zn/Mn family n=1 Tax=Fidelibacter multiformis TaxID=3377529 RepID=UPI0037DD593C